MTESWRKRRVALIGGTALASLIGLLGTAAPAIAQSNDQLSVNMLNLLVKQGVIKPDAAKQLLQQAQQMSAAPAKPAAPAPLSPPAGDATRVEYVSPLVKDQIRADLKKDVIAQAKAENWARPNEVPSWTKRITISGDVRLRDEYDLYSRLNDDQIINFAAFNANGPTDANPNTNLAGVPVLNTRQIRENQVSIRARLDIAAQVSDSVSADIRIGTGQTNTPVSLTQLLGGGLTKKAIWLDRAYIHLQPTSWIGGSVGRMPNPFFSTDLVYDTDLNFDGAAGSINYPITSAVTLGGTAGAFLTDYIDPNFPGNSIQKSPTATKWMLGSQITANWKTDAFNWKVGTAYYSFQNQQGQLSEPCNLYTGITFCSTDWSKPAFMQKGNTLFLIRNISPNPSLSDQAGNPAPQLAGLVFPYHILNFTSQFDWSFSDGRHLLLTGDYARNLAYDHSKVCRYGEAGLPLTNVLSPFGSNDTDVCASPPHSPAPEFKSGSNAFMLQGQYGDPDPWRFGEWNFLVGYKHIGADALIDAYTDADFHLGGTNAKGYYLIATVGLLEGANLQARWFSADEVSGPPLSIDVAQIDINVRF